MDETVKPDQRPMQNLLIDEMAWVQTVDSGDVWQWLAKGWDDLKACWTVSAVYAFIFTAFGVLITFGFYFMEVPYLILPSMSGFVLVGPALAIGFYEVSRRRLAGERCSLIDAFMAFRRNTLGIMGLGVFLVFLFQVWIRVSFTIAALNFPGVSPEWEAIITRALTTFDGVTFFISITFVGSIFAFVVFLAGAFSMPMMVDKKTILVPSMITSAFAVAHNKRVMMLWAGIIVIFSFVGLITGLVGLVLTFPLIGHATWHAYKQVIVPENLDEGNEK